MVGKLDNNRTRYSFECHFHDVRKNSSGKITSLLIITNKNESYFESLTINLFSPKEETIRIVEAEVTQDVIDFEKIKEFNQPRMPTTGEMGP